MATADADDAAAVGSQQQQPDQQGQRRRKLGKHVFDMLHACTTCTHGCTCARVGGYRGRLWHHVCRELTFTTAAATAMRMHAGRYFLVKLQERANNPDVTDVLWEANDGRLLVDHKPAASELGCSVGTLADYLSRQKFLKEGPFLRDQREYIEFICPAHFTRQATEGVLVSKCLENQKHAQAVKGDSATAVSGERA